MSLCTDRMLLVSADAMGQLRLDLFRSLGANLTRQLLSRYGHACGRHDALQLQIDGGEKAAREWLLAAPITHTLRGAARVELDSFEVDRGESLLQISGIWHDSYEVEQHLVHFGLSENPVCWSLAGYFSGYASTVWGEEIVCEELACRGKGDAQCRFQLHLGCEWQNRDQAMPQIDLRGAMRDLEVVLRDQVLQLEQKTKQLDALNAVLLDLTENLERQVDDFSAELRRSEEKYRSIVKDSNDGIVIYQGRDLAIQEVNRAFAQMCGRTAESCIGVSFLDFIHPDSQVTVQSNASRRLQSDPQAPQSYEIKALRNSATRHWQLTASRLTYQPQMVSVIIKDITEEKAQQEKLQQQEKLAGIGLLTSGVAHEIGNPLSSISSLAQLIELDTEDDAARGRSVEVRHHVDRIVRIVNQMMDFARPPNMEWSFIDVHAIIEGALGIAGYQRGFKQLRVEKHYGDLPLTHAMPEGLQQVFMNVIMNAVDAMKGNGTLGIRTQASDGLIRVDFADTGTGMTEEEQRHAFEPFFTTKEVGKGTGMGLAVSYGIIQRHEGSIRVQSTKGEGSVFTVEIPIHDEPAR